MADGWLPAAKAQVIDRAVERPCPATPTSRTRGMQAMLDSAKGLDATDLRRVGRRLVETVDPDGQALVEKSESSTARNAPRT